MQKRIAVLGTGANGATFTEPFDIVLMVPKAYDARWAAHFIAPHLAADGLLVGVQNGMTADIRNWDKPGRFREALRLGA